MPFISLRSSHNFYSSLFLNLRSSHLCHGTIDPEALTDRTTPISELQKQLQDAIDNENYTVAAQLRDEIEYGKKKCVFIFFLDLSLLSYY
jgi:protein-arginine kinase activator protein McsA